MDKESIIKENNGIINELIQEIINNTNQEAIEYIDNDNFKINETYKEIIDLEIQKILKIYHLEFPTLPDKRDSTILLKVYNGSHADAMYHDNALYLSYGTKKEFEHIKKGNIYNKELRYTIDSNGKIRYDKNGTDEKINTNYIDDGSGKPYFITADETIENDLDDFADYLYYYLNNKKYEELFFDVLPHELGHAYGFGSGIFEGTTENISREISNKYNLRNKPSARKHLVKLMQKIEKIIGRDKLVENINISNSENEKIDILSDLIDEKIQSTQRGLFKKYYYSSVQNDTYFSSFEQELLDKINAKQISIEEAQLQIKSNDTIKKNQELEDTYFKDLCTALDEYIGKNKNNLYPLGQSKIKRNNKDFDDVIEHQIREIKHLHIIINKIKESRDNSNSTFVKELKGFVKQDKNKQQNSEKTNHSPTIKPKDIIEL